MNTLSQSKQTSMLVRIITGIIFVLVVFPCLFLGGWFHFILVFLLAGFATYEILQAPGKNHFPLGIKILSYCFMFLFLISFFTKGWITRNNPFQLNVTPDFYSPLRFLYPILLVGTYFFIVALVGIISEKVQLQDITYLTTMMVFLAISFVGMLYLRYFPNGSGTVHANTYFKDVYGSKQWWVSSGLIITLCLGTWASDAGAYFVGILFGKHPMNKRVSPHKTWEGFIGGCIFSYIIFFGASAIFEYGLKSPLVPGILQFQTSEVLKEMNVLGGASWVFLAIFGLLLPFVGNLGGFFFSLIKRHYEIKDYGKILPGHGGIIDRFDSVLANCAMSSVLLFIMSYGFNVVL